MAVATHTDDAPSLVQVLHLIHFLFTTLLAKRDGRLHIIHGQIQIQRSEVTCPKPHCQLTIKYLAGNVLGGGGVAAV